MSSLQENSTVPLDVVNKRKAPFSRCDSFDKFQYTAFYTLQLAGKFSTLKIRNLMYDSEKIHTILPPLPMLCGCCSYSQRCNAFCCLLRVIFVFVCIVRIYLWKIPKTKPIMTFAINHSYGAYRL